MVELCVSAIEVSEWSNRLRIPSGHVGIDLSIRSSAPKSGRSSLDACGKLKDSLNDGADRNGDQVRNNAKIDAQLGTQHW